MFIVYVYLEEKMLVKASPVMKQEKKSKNRVGRYIQDGHKYINA